ncbi:hypothetical protein ULMS_16600 [Patiriisocius marinistellae]|uniref:Fibronectin type-III domain-containing protein n=1 Tax=Patiriisocius marinistellae TaxID=2494560 RepID=A0A5J4FY68_9FLAO|nr:S8 family serine peptidase [Patiriisocius marinistellae]GEQ86152.1 hypothetical protein ULMS_16600 [Patiriisocius marinistellae]
MKKSTFLSGVVLLAGMATAMAQTPAERQEIAAKYNQTALTQLEAELANDFEERQQKAMVAAAANGWDIEISLPDGGNALLVGLYPDGSPMYYSTDNREGGITTRTDRVHTGGAAGLDLNGENMLGGIWDGGRVRSTHNILNDRVTQMDNPASLSNHSTHVSGTMIGNGDLFAGQVKGMAHVASLIAYDFNSDEPEMTAEAGNGLLVSNHSYGIRADNGPLWYIGYYDNNARNIDRIIYNAPYYLPICSAGNDRQSGGNNGDGGYDYLTDKSLAKNNIVVAAVNEVLNYTGPNSVVMSSFSSWGPPDDGRIKPDISAKGVNMTSSGSGSNSAFSTLNGTSMATPNVSGSAMLLQQHYNDINGEFMKASTLRALILSTADEAGTAPGPDYRFGWGLMNTERAANVITNNGNTSMIAEASMQSNRAYTVSFTADGSNDVFVAVAWTDPEGNLLPSGNNDVNTPSLINDLDAVISQDGTSNTFSPWILDGSNFQSSATTGVNNVDNIEIIQFTPPAAGVYTLTVNHKGDFLVGENQDFAVVIDGISNQDFSVSTEDANIVKCAAEMTVDFNIDVEFDAGVTETVNFTVNGVPAGVTGTLTPSSLSSSGTVVLNLDDITGLAVGDYTMEIVGTGTSQTTSTFVTLEITDMSFITVVELDFPPNNAGNRPVDITLEWDAAAGDVDEYFYEVAKDEVFTDIVESASTPDLFVEITGLEFETEYFWRVRGANICGEGEFSDVRKFTTMIELGLGDNNIDGLQLYPNPTSNLLTISAAVQINTVEIYSVLGEQIKVVTLDGNSTTFDISSLASGTYFVKITSQNTSAVKQIIKK